MGGKASFSVPRRVCGRCHRSWAAGGAESIERLAPLDRFGTKYTLYVEILYGLHGRNHNAITDKYTQIPKSELTFASEYVFGPGAAQNGRIMLLDGPVWPRAELGWSIQVNREHSKPFQ